MENSSRQRSKLHKKLSLESFPSTTTSSSPTKPKQSGLTRNILVKDDTILDCSTKQFSKQFSQLSSTTLKDIGKTTKRLSTTEEILPGEEKTEVNVSQRPKVKLTRSRAFRRTKRNNIGKKSQTLGVSHFSLDGNNDELQNRMSLKTPMEDDEATTPPKRYEHSLSAIDDAEHKEENITEVVTGRIETPFFSYQAPVVQATRHDFSIEGKQEKVSSQENSVRCFYHEKQEEQDESDEEEEEDEEEEMEFDDIPSEVHSPDEVRHNTIRMCRTYHKVNFIVVQGTDNDSLGFVEGIASQSVTEEQPFTDSTYSSLEEDILFHEYLRKRPSRRQAVCEQIEKYQIEAKINGIKMTTFDLQ